MSNVGVQNDSNKMHMHVYSTSVTGALSDAGASIKRGTSRSLPVAVFDHRFNQVTVYNSTTNLIYS